MASVHDRLTITGFAPEVVKLSLAEAVLSPGPDGLLGSAAIGVPSGLTVMGRCVCWYVCVGMYIRVCVTSNLNCNLITCYTSA